MKERKNDWQTIVGSKQANAFRGRIDGISPCMTEAMGMGGGQIPLLTNATIEESQTEFFMEQMRGHEQNAIELPQELKGKKFRIRKLTPRECFRLMGVDDKDIDKIQAFPYETLIEHPAYSKAERFRGMTEKEKRAAMKRSISESAQYKLAGNSIVVDVLFHIFRRMFIDTEEPDFDGTPTQLTLF